MKTISVKKISHTNVIFSEKREADDNLTQSHTYSEFWQELIYLGVTKTIFLVYVVMFINQTVIANIFSVVFPLSIFFWGSLSFPRASKSFWIILIAYTQSIIFIKCIAHFDTLWDKNQTFLQVLGLNRKENFATYDLLLLLTLFLHRALLKKFGIWKTDIGFEFDEGSFELCSKDSKTETLIQQVKANQSLKEKIYQDAPFNKYKNESENQLLNQEHSHDEVLYRHEVNDSDNSIRQKTRKRNKLIKANESILIDAEGKLTIQLKQDDICMKLHTIKRKDAETEFSVKNVVIVEHKIEEMVIFSPAIIIMSLKKYVSLIKEILTGMVPKYRAQQRKSVDVYTFMFLLNFINFLVLLFGFSKFAVSLIGQISI